MPTEKRARQREARTQKLTRHTRTSKRQQRARTGRTVAILVGLVVVVAAALAFFGGDDDSDSTATGSTTTTSTTTAEEPVYSDPAASEAVLARTPPEPPGAAATTPADAVEREVLIEGTGASLEPGGTIVVHYVGVLGDGTTFDSSWPRGEPFETTIPGQVIDGWNEGLVGARVGDRIRLTIGSDKAYGSTARGEIPADSALMFDIDVVDVRPPSG